MFDNAMMSRGVLARRKKQRGLTIVEYAVAGAVVAIVTVGAFFALGGAISTEISAMAVAIETGGATPPSD